ncbi:hypothetical protein [Glycomyces tritici]|uniref:Uncharacterized protein n=1 Tax=Glycomyces tritici TaxID=2665176 RepID=A0ABT7YV55_9ACTN|nr:hypothetical protein [Glycomyces tritici]MDN3242504.1 hypothetical protein [Glycomyces tritici]
MKSHQDPTRPNAEPGVETDALRLSDIAGRDSVEMYENEPYDDEEALVTESGSRTGRIVMILAVAGIAAAAVVGAKIAYDRHKSASGYRKAVEHLEDARDAIMSAAGELPERSKAVLHRVTHR